MPKIVSRPANSGKRPGKPSSAAVRMYTDFRLPSRSAGRLSSCCSELVRCHTELRYGSLHKLITALLSGAPGDQFIKGKCDASGW